MSSPSLQQTAVATSEFRPEERVNAVKCAVGEGMFGFGMGLVAATTVLPMLIEQLGGGKIEVGLVFSIATAGWLLLQPVGLLVFGRRRRTKRFLIPWGFFWSVPTYLAIGAVIYFLGGPRQTLCRVLILALFAARIVGGGSTIPIWFEWQSRIFRQEIRGRAIGMIAAGSNVGVSIAAFAAAAVLHWMAFPQSHALLFAGSTAFFVVCLASYWSVREPALARRPGPVLAVGELFSRFGHSLGEANFRSYLIGRVILTMGGASAGFYAVHFKSPEGGGLAPSTVAALGVFVTLPGALASYTLGRLGDQQGHKVSIVLGMLAQAASIAFAFWGSGALACAAAFGFLGVSWATNWVSHVNMLFETCPHDNRAAHITLSNLVLSPFVLLMPLGLGALVQYAVPLRTGIGLTLIPTVLAVAWMVLFVRDPRTVDIREVAAEPRQAA